VSLLLLTLTVLVAQPVRFKLFTRFEISVLRVLEPQLTIPALFTAYFSAGIDRSIDWNSVLSSKPISTVPATAVRKIVAQTANSVAATPHHRAASTPETR
jgi:hypothetical protein